ncbi:phytyl ester synthase 2, chloroplastic-like isoform X2 [Malania oleifera]|uniref:phytyl ester synthase 2, chloroplastic-like isoform X2 n=1 Tax=Malania oleifera TaxID=397392 RepID=UPI0025AE9E84|nr:phytyl ester synthase 2, chloroplastic-like isoform X2 [Malania oleifera]
MAAAVAFYVATGFSPALRREVKSAHRHAGPTRRSAVSVEHQQAPASGIYENVTRRHEAEKAVSKPPENSDAPEIERRGLKDYFEESKSLIKSDGGPPRWFSPLECACRVSNSPLLLFLPGIDGTGLGLILHHQKLGKIFDMWCLHVPIMDRTPFTELVQLVEITVRSEFKRTPSRPIYLVGESLGACLALAVAARNPDIDLILILANPATSFGKSLLQPLIRLLEVMPSPMDLSLPYILSLMTGDPLKLAMANVEKGIPVPHAVGELPQGLFALSSYLPEDGVDLGVTIRGAGFYRRARNQDYVADYIPPTISEFKKSFEPFRWIDVATAPVMLSTVDDGKIVKGLAGIPSEGPVLFVGYHMLLGWEIYPLVSRFFLEKNTILRGIAHPMTFVKLRDGRLPDLSTFDIFRFMGAVPVSAVNFYKLLSSKSYVLLYPGGMREALHRKGEEYKLFWPEQSEFVRMAARFGAKIVPFGVVGEDDIAEVFFDYDDLNKIPYFKREIEELTNEAVKLRSGMTGEVANQDIHLPLIRPKLPGRFYFLFGKPIETEGRMQELKDKENAQELYLHAKSDVEQCIAYLKEKRKNDPYRNLLPRLIYQATTGFTSEVPTFEL